MASQSPPDVRAWTESDQAAWDAYVRAHPRATFFHQTGWKRVLEKTFSYRAVYRAAWREGRVCGVLPLFVCRSLRGRKGLYSLPHTVYGGPVGDDEEVEAALLDDARALGTELGADAIELRNRFPCLLNLPAVQGFVTFEKELPSDADQVYRTFPKKAREALNQARKKHGLAADFGGDLDTFYDLLASSYHRLGTPVFPKRLFAAMLDEFADCAGTLIVRHEGEPVAGVLSVTFRGTMMPLYSGEAAGVAQLKSSNFKYFKLMEYAVEQGMTRFDFGRSRTGNQGVVQFKVNQGFEAEALPYQIEVLREQKEHRPDPTKGLFFKARKVWRRLPAPAARFLGPRLVKYFP